MLSSLYGVWAAYAGDRGLSKRLIEEGYGKFCVGRFLQTLEYRQDVFPEQPPAAPFFANLGGFLYALLMGFLGICPGPAPFSEWGGGPLFFRKAGKRSKWIGYGCAASQPCFELEMAIGRLVWSLWKPDRVVGRPGPGVTPPRSRPGAGRQMEWHASQPLEAS
jgi:hypothetical protein